MKTDKIHCCTIKSDSIVQEQENKKVFRIINKSNGEVQVWRVDGCVIEGKEIRCDYIFRIESIKLHVVELKGTNHVHALRQIINTAEILELRKFTGEKFSYIVGAPSPKTASVYQSELTKLAKRFKEAGLNRPIKKNGLIEVDF